jgi:preprotein translocase subunit SecG
LKALAFTTFTIITTLTVQPAWTAANLPPCLQPGAKKVALFAANWYSHILNLVVIGLGLFLMLIVLIQRGKGGGLAGAFGGAGGSSPFGSRAADQFVRITLWLAGVWVLVIMIHVKVVKNDAKTLTETPIITQQTQ